MKKALKYIDGNSDKFWEIEVTGSSYTVTYGKNGTSGTTQTKSFGSDEECLKMAEKILAEKVKKGYSETGEVDVVSKPKSAKSKNADEVIEEYDSIIKAKKIDLLLPFLKEKSKGNVEVLKKHVKKSKRYWMTYTDLTKDPCYVKKDKHDYGWGTRGDFQQKEIITLSAIALFDKTDINSWDEALQLLEEAGHKQYVLETLQWAKPNWLETFILEKVRRDDWQSFNYHILRQFEELGLIQFNPELYALCLANTNEWRAKMKSRVFIAKVLEDKITYQRDIPEMFNYETGLQNISFRDNDKQSHDEFSTWAIVYKELLDQKKMERAFFFENAIQIQTKEWNNNIKSFFRKRIEEFSVTEDELIPFQENIFSLLHNAYPPITSYGIELVKKIYAHPKFKTKSFLEWLEPMMMRSDCKAGIKNVLPVLEKISKANSKLNNQIASIIADVFVIADLTLQERASKILVKLGSAKDKALKEKLSSYATLMQGNIKSGLGQFMDEDSLTVDDAGFEAYQFEAKKELLLTEEVELPKDWNEILFQFGNFISSDEALDTEILLNTYIQQRDLFPEDYTSQLQPYEKQLQKYYFESVHKNFVKAFLAQKIQNINNDYKIRDKHYSKINTLKLIQPLLEKVQQKIESNSKLPMLSFPSHKPYWVAPKVLVERVIAYQKANEEIDNLDLAIAIARMPRENAEEAIPLLAQVEGELKALLSFALGAEDKLTIDSTSLVSKVLATLGKTTKETGNLSLWAVASRTFYPDNTFSEFENTYLKEVPFVVSPYSPEIKFKEKWNEWKNYQTGVRERSPSWYELRFDMPNHTKIPNYLIYSQDIYTRSNSWDYNLNYAGNTYYWHSLTPQNSDALSLTLLNNCRVTDGSKPELRGFIDIMNRPEFRFSENALMLFATCFFQEKKDLRLLASETLINLIEKQILDIEKFALKTAFLASEKYGAFSRLTDGIIALKDISPLHNSALLLFFNAFFANLDVQEKLPTNFKKMVENYVDVLIKTNQKPSEKAVVFFEQWKDNASLKSLIKQILK
jgi:predicted DNA-binding WGR domain protein